MGASVPVKCEPRWVDACVLCVVQALLDERLRSNGSRRLFGNYGRVPCEVWSRWVDAGVLREARALNIMWTPAFHVKCEPRWFDERVAYEVRASLGCVDS